MRTVAEVGGVWDIGINAVLKGQGETWAEVVRRKGRQDSKGSNGQLGGCGIKGKELAAKQRGFVGRNRFAVLTAGDEEDDLVEEEADNKDLANKDFQKACEKERLKSEACRRGRGRWGGVKGPKAARTDR